MSGMTEQKAIEYLRMATDEPHKGEFSDEYREMCKLAIKALEKQIEYEDLEEQGLLLRLPCKVETPVYMVAVDCGGDTLDCRSCDCEGCGYLYSFVEENAFDTYMANEIGKTVFLTKEEAEAALKKAADEVNEYIDKILEGGE